MYKIVCFFIAGILFYTISYGQDKWTIDNGHSNIRFEVGWQDFSMRTGEFKEFEGNVTTNSIENLSNASFYLKVDPKSIDVIADRLSEQLIGERFLNADTFPEITFNSINVEVLSDSTYLVGGKLKIHGVENDQEVLVRYKGTKSEKRSYLLGLEVSLTLNRKDFGLEWGSPRLGEKVKIVGHLLYQIRKEEE